MDEVGLDLSRDLLQGRNHPVTPEERDAIERVELLELVDDETVVLAWARVVAARGDVHLVPELGESLGPTDEVARLRVADPEDAERISHAAAR